MYVSGLEQLQQPAPIVLYATHSAWWDSLVCFDLLYRQTGRDAYAMMDERSLDKLPFLGWIGGFGVRLGDREDGARAIDYAAHLLRTPRVVVMFPQGREQPLTQRPLGLKPGLDRLLQRVPEALALPVAIRYEHGREERPNLIVSIGASSRETEAALLDELERVEAAVRDGSFRHWPTAWSPGQARLVGERRS